MIIHCLLHIPRVPWVQEKARCTQEKENITSVKLMLDHIVQEGLYDLGSLVAQGMPGGPGPSSM